MLTDQTDVALFFRMLLALEYKFKFFKVPGYWIADGGVILLSDFR